MVGAGTAGLAITCALGRAGFCVELFDGTDRPNPYQMSDSIDSWDLRVSALTPSSVGFLEELGAWNFIADSRMESYSSMHVWDSNGTGRIDFSADEIGVASLGCIVENSLTQAALLASLKSCPNVKVNWQSRLSDMIVLGQDRLLTFDGGNTASAPLIIGADGTHSRVRELAGLRTRDWSYMQDAIVGTVALDTAHQSACWQVFLPTGPLALLPLADSKLAALVWSIDEPLCKEIIALSDERFIGFINESLERSAPSVIAVGSRASFPLRQCHAVDYVGDGLVLVADAAHNIHPLAGQGINLGLTDAKVLVEELIAAKSGGLPLASSVPLKRYQRRRKTENLSMMIAMEGFKRGFASADLATVLARNLGLKLVNKQTWLKSWFMRQALGS